jgi:hypothetical protein
VGLLGPRITLAVMVGAGAEPGHVDAVWERMPLLLIPWQAPASAGEPADGTGDALAEDDELPGPRRDELGMVALLGALRRLARHADGPKAWAAPLADDPIAFLLDAIGDAVNVWGPAGQLLCSNHAAAALALGCPGGPKIELISRGTRLYERRCLAFTLLEERYLLEVIAQVR